MSEKKMTRREALEFAIEAMSTMIEWEDEDLLEEVEEVFCILRDMIAQINE